MRVQGPGGARYIARAQKLLQDGKLQEAKQAFSGLCEKGPGDASLWAVLGNIEGRLGNFQSAAACFTRALGLRPRDFDLAFNLGVALSHAGDTHGAIRAYEKAAEIAPARPEPHANLVSAHAMLNNFAAAAAAARRRIEVDRNAPDAYLQLAELLSNQGDYRDAGHLCADALQIDPQNAKAYFCRGTIFGRQGIEDRALADLSRAAQLQPAWAMPPFMLGKIHHHRRETREAEEFLRRALQLDPELTECAQLLGELLLGEGRGDEALACFETVGRKDPQRIESRIFACLCHETVGRYREAIQCYQDVLRSAPANEDVQAALAHLHERHGEFDAASKIVMPAIDAGTRNARMLTVYADLCRATGQPGIAVARLEEFVAVSGQGSRNLAQIHYALGALYDATAEWDRAFDSMRRANELDNVAFDLRAFSRFVDASIATFAPANAARLPRLALATELPVFIVGMPRSGTSLVEQILASHPDVQGAGELSHIEGFVNTLDRAAASRGLSPFPEFLFSTLPPVLDTFASNYLNHIGTLAAGAKRVTDKHPLNFRYLGFIQLMFPMARVIHCTRDPLDTCLSIYFHAFARRNAFANNLATLGGYYRECERLMSHWRQSPALPLLEVSYEQLVASPEIVARQMLEFIGLPWNDSCMRFFENRRAVATPSYGQVRRPIYSTSVGRAQAYAQHLTPLIEALAGRQCDP